jgi:hypothetical protein
MKSLSGFPEQLPETTYRRYADLVRRREVVKRLPSLEQNPSDEPFDHEPALFSLAMFSLAMFSLMHPRH